MNKNPTVGTVAGFHVAGNSQRGFGISNFISRDFLIKMIKLCPEKPIDEDLFGNIAYQPEMGMILDYFHDNKDLPSRFLPEFTVTKPVSKPFKSDIVKSVLYNCWDFKAQMLPSCLHSVNRGGEILDPYVIARNKQGKPWINVDKVSLKNNADAYFERMISQSDKLVEARIYDFEESILGLKDDPDFKSVNRQSSPGFPIIVDSSFKGRKKEGLLGRDEDFDMNLPSLKLVKARVEEVILAAANHIRLLHINTDNLKDEKRFIAKVLAALSRLFSGAPFDQLILVRMYCGAFCNYFMKNRISNGSAIGLDPTGTEWDVLARHLSEVTDKGKSFLSGDYAQFDNCELSIIQFTVMDIIERWYQHYGVVDPVDTCVRLLIIVEVTNSKHLYGDEVYTTRGGLPSGHPLTPIINSIYNLLLLRMAWTDINQDNSIMMAKLYDDFVRPIVLGDDNASGVHPKYTKIYTPKAVANSMTKVGMTYTSETKTECTETLRELHEIEFLKRKFIFHTGFRQTIAPLRLEVVLEIPYWTKNKGGLSRTITCDNVQSTLLELSLHGKEVYNIWAPQILKASSERLDYVPEHFLYDTCLCFVLGKGSLLC
jgi:hypothetical protein